MLVIVIDFDWRYEGKRRYRVIIFISNFVS